MFSYVESDYDQFHRSHAINDAHLRANYCLVYIQLERQSYVNVRKAIDFWWDVRTEKGLKDTTSKFLTSMILPQSFIDFLLFIFFLSLIKKKCWFNDWASRIPQSKITWQWRRKVKKDISIFVSLFLFSSFGFFYMNNVWRDTLWVSKHNFLLFFLFFLAK